MLAPWRWPAMDGPRVAVSARPPRLQRRRARRTLAWALAAALVMNFGLGLAAEWFHAVRDPIYADKELRLRRHVAAAEPGTPLVMMLGTSRTGFGFNAAAVERHLHADLGRPATAFNFGVPATGSVTHLLYFRRVLNAGHTPDLLVVEILPTAIADLPGGPIEQWFVTGDRLHQSEVEAAIAYGFPAGHTRDAWRESLGNPWYALRFALLGRVAASWLPWQLRQDCGRTTDSLGWLDPRASDVAPEAKRDAFARARSEYAHVLAGMTPGGGSVRALADLIALARERGVTVKLLIMPESPAFRTMYHPDVNARLVAFMNEFSQVHQVGWVDARDWLPESAFYDGHHMLRPGAEAFSQRLATDVIAPFLRNR